MKRLIVIVVSAVTLIGAYGVFFKAEEKGTILLTPSAVENAPEIPGAMEIKPSIKQDQQAVVMSESKVVNPQIDDTSGYSEQEVIAADDLAEEFVVDEIGGYFDKTALGPGEETVQILDTEPLGDENVFGIPLESITESTIFDDIEKPSEGRSQE